MKEAKRGIPLGVLVSYITMRYQNRQMSTNFLALFNYILG